MFLLLQVFFKFETTWVIFEACSTLNNKEMPNEVKKHGIFYMFTWNKIKLLALKPLTLKIKCITFPFYYRLSKV